MQQNRFDVIVVGGGPAGITAAAALGKSGFSVLVCEAAVYPGAENWSGAVYFTENLEADDAFGRAAIEKAPFERRLVERGFYLYNGHSLLGAALRDADVFRSCYTVLRPVYDRYLAELSREHGVVLLCETTVQSLIRHDGRVIGVHTERGPAYADVVFLAEGDASHLVTQEGYERVGADSPAGDHGPHFLQGIKEVVTLPAGALEERFGLPQAGGGAYEMLLRNGNRGRRTVRLNMGAFLYTNRDSVSLGLVLPVDNLARSFDGDHNLLMEWYKGLPEVARWIDGGEVTSYGAKIIRGGGLREIPRLVDDGLAIGGAASGIGLDFPYPNFTGPATAMGLLFARAVRAIAADGGGPGAAARGGVGQSPFSAAALEQAYLQPLRRTHYYRNVERLADWPGYIERTQMFFERQLDAINGAAFIISRPDLPAPRRWWEALRLKRRVVGFKRAGALLADLRASSRALGLGRAAWAGTGAGTVAHWLLNTVTALLPSRRARLGGDASTGVAEVPTPGGGSFRAVFRVMAGAQPAGRMPWLGRWYWRRFGAALAGAFADVYTNDDEGLDDKLPRALGRIVATLSIWDLVVGAFIVVAGLAGAGLQAAMEWFQYVVLKKDIEAFRGQLVDRTLEENRNRLRLDDDAVQIVTPYEHKLGTIRYREGEHSHIKVLWPDELTARGELRDSPLWSVCPARVYELNANPRGMPGVVVNFDNCVKCETCWRATSDVHWSRATQQRLIYETYTPAHGELRRYLLARPEPAPHLRGLPPWWETYWSAAGAGADAALAGRDDAGGATFAAAVAGLDDAGCATLSAAAAEIDRFATSLEGYSHALGDSPLTLEEGERHHLEELLGIAARRFAAARRRWEAAPLAGWRDRLGDSAVSIWSDATARVDDMLRHASRKRYFWSDVIGKQIRDHHLRGLRHLMEGAGVALEADATRAWSAAWRALESRPARFDAVRRGIRDWCEEHIDAAALRELEEQEPPRAELRAWLGHQLQAALNDGRGDGVYGRRDVLLEELAAIDPSLAVLAAQHLLACDLLEGAPAAGALAGELRGGRALAAVVSQGSIGNRPLLSGDTAAGSEEAAAGAAELHGEAPLVTAALADWLLVTHEDRCYLVAIDEAGVELEAVGCIGLAGAGVRRVVFDGCVVPADRIFASPLLATGSAMPAPSVGEPFTDLLEVGVLDHLAIVRGAGDYLTRRAREHAASRIQFPGAFQDEAGRDTIAKFGAVKQMLAEMESRRILVETLSLVDPAPGDAWTGAAVRKLLAAEAFGPGEGSFGYNCGQLFGGTAFSEDDCIAKYYRDSSPFRFLLAHDDALRVEIGRRRLAALRDGGSLVPLSAEEAAWLEDVGDEGPLAEVVSRWQAARAEIEGWAAGLAVDAEVDAEVDAAVDTEVDVEGDPELDDLLRHQAGDAVARALAAKVCILRSAWRLECGAAAEATLEATRLLTDRFAAEAPALAAGVDLLEETLRVGRETVALGDFEPAARIPDAEDYDAVLATDHAAESGEWLQRPFDAGHLRYVPEMLWNDPGLRAFREELEAAQRRRFVEPLFDGLPYGRWLEKLHIVPEDDLDYLVRRGYLRMPIAPELGGEGATKARYYIVCEMTGRYGDAALSLAIMANTSIGTTPMLLGLHQDLPRAHEELDKVKADPALLGDIRAGLDGLIAGRARPDFESLQRDYLALTDLVKKRILKSSVLKYIGAGFLRAFFAAGSAGQQRDLEGFFTNLAEAHGRIDEIVDGVEDRLREYPRRERAHELFLKMISAGYVSAFALTEPTAGSDSGGVKTTARLQRRRVHEDDDGVLYFWLDEEGESERRNLLDADRLEFDFEGRRLLYRWSDDAEAAEVRHDEYDYEKDRPGHWRTYEHDGRKVAFSDIAQVRTDESGQCWYEFWELNGAKMWITNGRFAHCFALYANTEPEGVTGFMVDRHAEGLVVGSDEEKLGQRGSPTNELSLTGVRVPRECIIGFRGRGQVNALETLNTGRTGLAVTTRSTIQEMMEDALDFLGSQTEGQDVPAGRYPRQETPPTALQLFWMGRLMEELVATAAVSNELIGLFDHPLTRDVRMESAIGKYYGSEAEHDGIDWMERLRGLDGQTHRHRIEKTRRDARVLNIYEGTNEVQRYLLLRDLAQRVLPAWKAARDSGAAGGAESAAEGGAGAREGGAGAREGAHADLRGGLEELKERLMARLDEAMGALGDIVFNNVNLQPCFFRLVEIAGLIKVMDALLYRVEWLAAHQVPAAYRARLERASRLAFERCRQRAATLERRYASSYAYVREGRYPPDARLGFLSLDPRGADAERWGAPIGLVAEGAGAPLGRPVRIAVLVKPVPVVAPHPRLGAGGFEEALYDIDGVDARSLQLALALKRRDPDGVGLTAYSIAGTAGAEVLRRVLAMGADDAVLMTPEKGAEVLQDPISVARLLHATLAARPADIVLCGAAAADTGQGVVGPALAAMLGCEHIDGVTSALWSEAPEPALRVTARGWQGHELDLPLPCVLAVAPVAEHVEPPYSLEAFLAAAGADMARREVGAGAMGAAPMSVQHEPRRSTASATHGAIARTPEEAAAVLLEVAGLTGSGAEVEVTPYDGDPLGFGQQPEDGGRACLFLCEPVAADELAAPTLAALDAAAGLARAIGLPLDVVLPAAERAGRDAAIGRLLAAGVARRIFALEHPRIAAFGWRGHIEWLHEFWGMYRGEAKWLLGPEWAGTLFARFAGQGPPAVERSWPWLHVESVRNGDGSLRLGAAIFDGAALACAVPPAEGLRMVTFTAGARIEAGGKVGTSNPVDAAQVFAYQPAIDYDPQADPVAALLERLGGGELTLREAEYVVDFGYGGGGREGLEGLAEPLLELLVDELGLSESMIGGTRKVTQDLEVLPMDRQIGQTGVRVGPKVLMALGVSGAPQHVDWIDDATVVLAFNIDPDAPLMRLNDQRPAPVVHPIVGDVKETVPRFMEALRAARQQGAADTTTG